MGRTTSKKASTAALIKTFTYYIPGPSQRKSGYREKEFDKIMQGILGLGFELVSLQTSTLPHGVMIVVVIKAKNKKIFDQDIKLDIQEKFQLSNTHSSPDIELELDNE